MVKVYWDVNSSTKKSLRCINNYPETVQTGENMGNEGQQLAPFSEMETEAMVIF